MIKRELYLSKIRDSYDSERSNYYILTAEGKYVPAKNIYPTYASLPANIVLFELLQVYKKTDEAFSINETPLFLMTYDSKNPVYIRKPVNPNDKTSTLYNYINLTEANIDPTCKTDYYQFEKENVSVFYEPYRYHYKVIDESNPYFGSYLLDRQKNMERDPEKTDFYYELGKKGKIIKVTKDFFEPNKYYDIDGNLIETKPIDTNTVYEKRDLFVVEDSNSLDMNIAVVVAVVEDNTGLFEEYNKNSCIHMEFQYWSCWLYLKTVLLYYLIYHMKFDSFEKMNLK